VAALGGFSSLRTEPSMVADQKGEAMFRLPALDDTRRFDTGTAASSAGKFGDLPEWDLTDLYAAPDAPEVARDFDWLEKPAPTSPPITRASWPGWTPPPCSTACAL
jgi:hypothetical protein